jgi:transcriptional regulator with XRE-family HTH domain
MTSNVTAAVTPGDGRGLTRRTAAQIRALMAARRLTGRDLGAVLELSPAAISRRLYGDGSFSLDEVEVTAEWLGVPLTDIIAPAKGPLSYSP